ncbi:hypothetical protein UlMin_023769 [Ulmus minor]
MDLCVSRHSPEENPKHNPKENPFFSSPSSSCVDPSLYNYDVFISFRGDDTRLNFTSHLYKALCQNRIRPYIDEDRLEKGDDVSRALSKAIEESAISIVIFSTNYASSTWCLDELVHIIKCKKEKSQIVLPIFHGVDPSDIRKQERSYANAFVEHELRFNNTIHKVQEWRQALIEASGLSGWDSRGKSEADIVEKVVNDVKEKLKYIRSNDRIEDLLKCLKPKLQLANMVLNDVEEKQLTNQVVNKDENIHISIEISKNGRDRYRNQRYVNFF